MPAGLEPHARARYTEENQVKIGKTRDVIKSTRSENVYLEKILHKINVLDTLYIPEYC